MPRAVPKRPRVVRAVPKGDPLTRGEKHVLPERFLLPDFQETVIGQGEADEKALEVTLPGFLTEGRDTLVLTATVTASSEKYALNILPLNPDDQNRDDPSEILVHFNPRQYDRGGRVVLNNKTEGNWGRNDTAPLREKPPMFCLDHAQYVIQVTSTGFRFIVNGHVAGFFGCRTKPPAANDTLLLHFPPRDDYSNPHFWTIHSVWWGPGAQLQGGGERTAWAQKSSHNSSHRRY